jgi:hypothetical protein
MQNSSKREKFKTTGKIFFFVWLACLFSFPNSFSTGMNLTVDPAEIRWRKEFKAIINGEVLDCAYSGGTEFCKPTFVDIDADDDFDMFIGEEGGRISLFRNDGTKDQPRWSFVSDFYDSIDVGEKSAPFFADIDGDGDFDLFVGHAEGTIVFYQNDGDSNFPLLRKITDNYEAIDVGEKSVPFLVDIDADLRLDLFIGTKEGVVHFYGNEGTEEAPIWKLVTESYGSIDVGAGSNPHFVDIDNDGDFDLFIGEDPGNVNFYKNVGNPISAAWDSITSNYNDVNVGRYSFPVFMDIDDDSDFDLFIGQKEGRICFYRNEGNPWLSNWSFVTKNYNFIDLGGYTKPALADVDADGDFDLFVGEEEGNIDFYRNEATFPILSWALVTENYYSIEAEDHSHPTFADIDSDGDLDLFVGKDGGRIEFYQNIGSSDSASWMLVSDNYHSIDVGTYSSPTFVDIDGDFDLDLFIGQKNGKISFYRNDGIPQEPSWIFVSEDYNSIYVGDYSVPTFADLDLDGDFDLLVGNGEGKISFYKNDGTPQADSFVLITHYYDSIDVGDRGSPFLCDVDLDGDPDLFTGEAEGGLHCYKNLTLNSIRGKVTDNENNPLSDAVVYMSGDQNDTTFTDLSGNYQFIGLPVGSYCVYRDPETFQYCFTPLDSDTFEIDFGRTTEVDEVMDTFNLSPETYHLSQNYPNPFNPVTRFTLDLVNEILVSFVIYNIAGQKVRTLTNQIMSAGSHILVWDGTNDNGQPLSSGVYFYRVIAGDNVVTRKMMLLK